MTLLKRNTSKRAQARKAAAKRAKAAKKSAKRWHLKKTLQKAVPRRVAVAAGGAVAAVAGALTFRKRKGSKAAPAYTPPVASTPPTPPSPAPPGRSPVAPPKPPTPPSTAPPVPPAPPAAPPETDFTSPEDTPPPSSA